MILVVLMVGVLSIQSCTRYKIEIVNHRDGDVVYVPMKRYKGIWEKTGHIYSTESESRDVIKKWEEERRFIKQSKKHKFIKIQYKY